MKKQAKFFIVFTAILFIASCSGYGKKLEFNKTEVYYTKKVSKKAAQKLGEFLVRAKFANGKTKSVQLTKNEQNNHYVFRMVTTKEASKSKTYEVIFKVFASQISDSVFNKQPVDFHVCNNRFKTLKELPFKSL